MRSLCEKRRHTRQRQRTAANVMRAAGGIEAKVINRGPTGAIAGRNHVSQVISVAQRFHHQRQRWRGATAGIVQMVSGVSRCPVVQNLDQPIGRDVSGDDISWDPD